MNPAAPTDLFLAALAQLATLMAANWTATEALGNYLRAASVPKLLISCVLAPAFCMAAYAFGWFTALPTVAANAVPVTGGRGYLSAAFAGLVAALVTSGAHGLVKAATGGTGGGQSAPPAPPAGA